MSRHIVILGAGISGLAMAWFLKQALGSHLHLTLIEKNSRAGGWIQTIQTDGFLFEQGPRSCRTQGSGQETLALIEALGLQNQVLIPHKQARNRYIYHHQRLQRMPKHLWEIPFNPLTRGWIKALWQDWRMPKRQVEDESIQAFFSRRLGHSWVERLIDPFVSGIYAGDCSRLSLKSCFPLFDQWEQQQGSLLRGAWQAHRLAPPTPFMQSMRSVPLFSFKEGMETLPRTLASCLKEELLLKTGVTQLVFNQAQVEVHLDNGQRIQADQVVSTLPTFVLSSLLDSYLPISQLLKDLHYTTVQVVNLGFKTAVLPLEGFGYLIPSSEKSPILGCVWDSSIFPEQNGQDHQTRLTVMMGGRHHPEIDKKSDQEIIELALQALSQQLGICKIPDVMQIKRAREAIPQYELGYANWRKQLEQALSLFSSRLLISGSSWAGVSINDGIAYSRRLAQQIAREWRIDP